MAGTDPRGTSAAPGSAAWWQQQAQRSRRSSALTADRIVDAAIELLDREGLAAFSMRRLAAEVGAAAGSLYRHFESREAVLVAVHDRLVGEGLAADPPGATVQERTVSLMRNQWRLLMERPYLATIWTSTEQLGPNALRARERALRLSIDEGASPELAARLFLTLLHYTIAFAALHHSLGVRTPEDRAQTRAFLLELPESEFPALRSVARDLVDVTVEEEFEFGLQAIIAGLTVIAQPG